VAFNIVQSASGTGSGSASAIFSSSNTAGNALIIVVGENVLADTFSLSDSLGNVYISLAQLFADGGIDGKGVWQLFYSLGCIGGVNTVSVVAPGGGATFIAAHEFPSLSILDAQSNGTGSGVSLSSGSATTTSPTELLFAFGGGIGHGITGLNADAGWTLAQRSVSSSFMTITEWQGVTSIGTSNASATATTGKVGGIDAWIMELVTFLIGTPPAPPSAPPTPNRFDQLSSTTHASFPGDRGGEKHGKLSVVGDMTQP
jgi:hypothetical protein